MARDLGQQRGAPQLRVLRRRKPVKEPGIRPARPARQGDRICFTLYTLSRGVLNMSVQLYPLARHGIRFVIVDTNTLK